MVPIKSDEAMVWIHKAAENGNAKAQLYVANCFAWGICGLGPRDPSEAAKWYRLSAEQGEPDAQSRLATSYYSGEGVPKDYVEAGKWFRKAAEQQGGWSDAETMLALMYDRGNGMPQDHAEAAKWFRKAAEKGEADAQVMLGFKYELGEGVSQDFVQAHMWFNLAGAKGDSDAQRSRDRVGEQMTAEQISQAQEMARNWRPKTDQLAPAQRSSPPDTDTAVRSQPESTGTGFVVSRQGFAITNQHVIDGCMAVTTQLASRRQKITIAEVDPQNNLALLKLPNVQSEFARLQTGAGVRLGEFVMAVGYPLRGLLSSGVNVTSGTVSAVAGIGDDIRYLQVTAPVQPGNSGGPLLDQRGNVIGVVVSKLDAVKVAKITGDIPQNVNFAIKGSIIRAFLDAHSVDYATGSSSVRIDPENIADHASKFTFVVECWK